MGKVILIGGSPMVGKSTVAIEIASSAKCPCISTDDIGEALQTVVPINPMQGKDFRDYFKNTAPDKLLTDIQQYHHALEPAIQRLVDIHSTWGNSVVLEGWALYPRFIKPIIGHNVFAVWLIASNELLEARLLNRSGFLEGIAAQNYLLRSKWHNDLLLQQCNVFDTHYILINGNDSAKLLAEKILFFTS
ncbi:MAG: AAA family ATPase [Clostridiaceae bacterium]|nr:AAA family ATPase [Clostridiaceae bacterium]